MRGGGDGERPLEKTDLFDKYPKKRCPKCGSECIRDEVDIGVGTQYGPWRCPDCGWSQLDEAKKNFPGLFSD